MNLTGQVNGKEVTFRYDAEFADQELEREFIPRLWATRRVGNLLALMRKEGEQKELKDEVIDLAKRFGIVTPYTSYLVVEDEELAQVPVQDDIRKSRAGRRPSVMAPPAQGSGHRSESRADEGAFRSTRVSGAPESEADRLSDLASSHTDKLVRLGSSERGKLKESISQFMDASAGAQAVAASREVQELKNADVAANSSVPVSFKSVDGRTFELKGGIWTDQDYKPEMESLSIKYGSKAYFDLVFSRKELKRSFALGKRVIIVVTGKALIVGNEGQEELTAEAMEEFFRVP